MKSLSQSETVDEFGIIKKNEANFRKRSSHQQKKESYELEKTEDGHFSHKFKKDVIPPSISFQAIEKELNS